MSAVFAIARREMEAVFTTVIGWMALLGFVFFNGLIFIWAASEYAQPSMGGPAFDIDRHLIPDLFGTISFMLLLLLPAVSMRLFSEDQRQGSFEMLLSAPLASWEIVLGKFFGAMGFVCLMLLSLSHCFLGLFWMGSPDLGVLAMNILSILLFSGACISIGMLFSSFTKNQFIALSLSFVTCLAFWISDGVSQLATGSLAEALSHLSFMPHLDRMGQGVLHLKDLGYFTCFTGFFLFATLQRIEANRWT